jgi:hypothetical protein
MSKYYTPTIEEFHVGFEYYFCSAYQEGVSTTEVEIDGIDGYEPETFNFDIWNYMRNKNESWKDLFQSMIDHNQVKVKYLDKEDVKSILEEFGYKIGDEYCTGGWSKSYLDELEWYIEGFNDKEGHDLFIFKDESKGLISIEDDEVFKFIGNIKNKSELKIILKQLNLLHD